LHGSNVSSHYIMVTLKHFILYQYDYCNASHSFALQHVEGLQGTEYQYCDISVNNISCDKNHNIMHLYLQVLFIPFVMHLMPTVWNLIWWQISRGDKYTSLALSLTGIVKSERLAQIMEHLQLVTCSRNFQSHAS